MIVEWNAYSEGNVTIIIWEEALQLPLMFGINLHCYSSYDHSRWYMETETYLHIYRIEGWVFDDIEGCSLHMIYFTRFFLPLLLTILRKCQYSITFHNFSPPSKVQSVFCLAWKSKHLLIWSNNMEVLVFLTFII